MGGLYTCLCERNDTAGVDRAKLRFGAIRDAVVPWRHMPGN